jgi:protein SCO1
VSNAQTNRISTAILLLSVGVLAVAAGIWVADKRTSQVVAVPAGLEATVLPQPRPLEPFSLVDHRGEPFTSDQLNGRWTFTFFGYTHCPDICPNALGVLNAVDTRLARDPALHRDLQVVFVSVDPERDTPEQLAQFVPYFNPSFIGLSGTPEQVRDFTGQIGIMYMRTPAPGGESEEGYFVDHTSSIMLFDPKGRLHALFSTPHDPEAIAHAFATIRQRYRN